ncbi:DUF4139 domain-containing protein [Marivivens marinus]|uniref:DUF4139 domain-containing protein n=1 Tax=Marivivens marinus TaxID=3110173 RepID=UPI003B846AB0
MKSFILAVASILPTAVLADTFDVPTRIDSVVVYPSIAEVRREIVFEAPAGRHTLRFVAPASEFEDILPQIELPDGVTLMSYRVIQSRPPVLGELAGPDVIAARDTLENLERAIADKDAESAAIHREIAAIQTQMTFLETLGSGQPVGTDLDHLRAVLGWMGEETQALAATQTEAHARLAALSEEREELLDDLADAEQALDYLIAEIPDLATIELVLDLSDDGEQSLFFTDFRGGVDWRPVYDLNLVTGPAPHVTVAVSAIVTQETGEDWTGVALGLATVFPMSDNYIRRPYAWRRTIVEERQISTASDTMQMEPVIVEESAAPHPLENGLPRIISIPNRVDLRSGSDVLQVELEHFETEVDLFALGVTGEGTGFRAVTFINTSPNVVLEGSAIMKVDGALVGAGEMPLLASGEDTELLFGRLQGLLISSLTTDELEGTDGYFSRSNHDRSAWSLTVENLTGEDWPLRLRTGVSYSTHEDLVIEYDFSQPPYTGPDAPERRGVIEWRHPLAAGDTYVIDLVETMEWPEGFQLR